MKRVLPLVLVTAVIFGGCGTATTTTKSNADNTIKTTTAPKDVYMFAGKIQADESVNLTSKISGKVSQISVDVGSTVNAGDPIVILDTQDLQAQVNQAQAAVQTAQANLQKVQSGSRPEQIASAKASLSGAEKSYQVIQDTYNRQKQLFDGGYISKQEMEQVEGQLATVKAQYEAAQHQLELLQNGATQEDVNVATSSVSQAQAAVETLKTQLNNGVITSPISGTVSAKNISVGELASVGDTLVSIVNSGQLHVESYVPSDLATGLKVGQEVVVKVSELSNKVFQGEITVINSQVDSRNKNVLVKVALKEGNDILKSGMFAEIGLRK